MSKVSTARKIGVVARVATQQAQRSRTLRAAGKAVATTGRAFGGVLHQLWLEVIGVLFLMMALKVGAATASEYAKYHAGQAGLRWVAIGICGTLTFVWFGVSSFWRVKKKSRVR